MMFDQSDVIRSNVTHIDRLKGADFVSRLAGISEVFGLGSHGVETRRFRSDWLSPFVKVCFPPSVQDEVFGFCRPCAKNTPETELSTRRGARSIVEIV
jgi:hypothetical protein